MSQRRTPAPASRAGWPAAQPAPRPQDGLVAVPGPPEAGVDYSASLAEAGVPRQRLWARAALGVLAALSLYFLVVQIVSELVVWVGWSVSDKEQSFARYLTDALGFVHLSGLLATNLALAMLTPVALLVAARLHGRAPRWMCSVQPGMRWRYLLLCLPIALAVLAGIQLVGHQGSWRPTPQAQWWLWLLVVLFTSPLQAAGEEFFFRGYLLQAFGSLLPEASVRLRQAVAVLASAGVFALFHGVQNPALFCDRFGFGLLAGWLVLATGGLEAGIACHVVNNLMAFGFAALYGHISDARAMQAIGWQQAGVDLVAFALFALFAWLAGRGMRLASRTPGAIDEADGARLALAGKSR